MKAVLIATGENADRLAPLTAHIPSPMIPIVGRPVSEYAIQRLHRAGIREITVCLHHLSGSVESFFSNGRRWGVTLNYVLLRDPLGTAGAVNWAKGTLGNEPFVVMPADTVVDINLIELITCHQTENRLITVAGHTVRTDYNPFPAELNFPRLGDTGVYVCQPEVLAHIPARKKIDIRTDLLPRLVAAGHQPAIYHAHGYWNPLRNFQDYQQAQVDFLNVVSKGKSEAGEDTAVQPRLAAIHDKIQLRPNIWVGRNHLAHPTARPRGPIYIGDNCQIGADVEIGPYTIIGSNVIIDEGATVVNSTVMNHTYIGRLVNVENRIVDRYHMIDAESSQTLEVVDEFLITEANPALLYIGLRRLVDGVAAGVLLIFLSPLLLLGAMLALLGSGRILARSERMGIPARSSAVSRRPEPQPFFLHRFATHRLMGKSPNIIGRLLQKSGLHRLPELWNVVRGDLVLVGVKPLTPPQNRRLTEDWQRTRFDYMCGLTGLWFVEHTADSTIDEQIISDVYYVATRNWRQDLKLLARTPVAWWQRTFSSSRT